MKTIVTLMMCCCLWINLVAQAPQKMSYQAVIRDTGGNLVINKTVGMRITILRGALPGIPIYIETHTPTTNPNGLVTLEIGGTAKFDTLNWGSDIHFIKTETDPAGGTNYTISGTSQLLSVPYALYAKSSGNGLSGDYNDLTDKPVILNNALQTTATGYQALLSNTGTDGTAHGYQALWNNTTGNDNTATGTFALKDNSTGWGNTANGSMSLMINTTGYRNTANGVVALPANTTGSDNTATGAYSLYSNSIGWSNTANGARALYSNTEGNVNTADGAEAGYSNVSGNYNVFLGYRAGYYETGSNKLYIDNQSRASESDAREKALIYGVFDGDPANQILAINGTVKINNRKITMLSDPENPQDAATKAYVNAQDSAIKAYVHGIFKAIELIPNNFESFVYDIEGNSYPTIKVGSQVWMAENLRTTRYNDVTAIPNVTDSLAWKGCSTDAYCWYNNDIEEMYIYGALYNKRAVSTGKLCPSGWRVPSDTDWSVLADYLINNGYGYGGSGEDIAKSMAAKTNWNYSSTQGTPGNDAASNNSSGFSGLPGGLRNAFGSFGDIGGTGYWWSSSFHLCRLNFYYPTFTYGAIFDMWNMGYGVRCVRDN